MLASLMGRVELCRVLLQAGASERVRERGSGRQARDLAKDDATRAVFDSTSQF
jgi:hypothetical protein